MFRATRFVSVARVSHHFKAYLSLCGERIQDPIHILGNRIATDNGSVIAGKGLVQGPGRWLGEKTLCVRDTCSSYFRLDAVS